MGLSRPRWTREETETLKRLYRTTKAPELARMLSRPVQAIRVKAHKLGLSESRRTNRKCEKKLTPEQKAMLRREYPHIRTSVLAAMMGLGTRTVVRRARELGLEKSPEFMRECQRFSAKRAKESHLKNGTYNPRGVVPENFKKGEAYQFKPGHAPTYRGGRKPGSKNKPKQPTA